MKRQAPYLLLVDDDPDDQEMLLEEVLLHNPGMRVERVGNGVQALSYLEGCKNEELPAIMVVDYQMPDMTGAELLSLMEARNRCHAIVKIMWSTSDKEEYVKKSEQFGASAYFRKPNTITELTKIVNYLTGVFRNRCMTDLIC